jgi:hypothetical protein
MRHFFGFLCVALLLLSTTALGQQIRGDYIETRSADVYTGQCFANGEVNLVGDEAILAWHIQSGSWDGVSLDGLTVAAAVHAHAPIRRWLFFSWTTRQLRSRVRHWSLSRTKWGVNFCVTHSK